MILTCYCCGERYERGMFRCCAPPKGTPSHVWLGQHCTICRPSPERTRCPRHCICEVRTPIERGIRPLAELAEQAAARLLSLRERLRDLPMGRGSSGVEVLAREEWTPYKENREPGEDG